MTTIISVPFKEGAIVISDTRATDQRLRQYIASNKVSPLLGYSISPNVSVYIGGAGASIGTETIIYPFMKYLQKKSNEYCVNLDIMEISEFVDYINNVSATYISKVITPMELQIMNACQFLILIKTPKFMATFKSAYLGGLALTADLLNQFTNKTHVNNASLFEGVGSGSMYVLGALLLENEKSPLYLKEQEQMIDWVKKYFKISISKDLGSSTDYGLNIRVIYKGEKESKNIRI